MTASLDAQVNSQDQTATDFNPNRAPQLRSYEERVAKMKEMANVTDYVEFRKKNYKPKVSTWGVFERPKDISKAFGGGRTIKAGEYDKWLEQQKKVEEEKRKLLGTQEEKFDPKLEQEARQNMSIAFTMLENTQFYEAKDLFQTVRMKFPFRSKIAGKATYGLAMALDALGQTGKAQDLYKSLKLHPNMEIKKSAKMLLSGIEAMKFFGVSAEDDTDYSSFDRYFEGLGRVRRFDLSQSSLFKRTEKDIAQEKEDLLLSVGILLGLFLIPAFLVGSLRLRSHPVTVSDVVNTAQQWSAVARAVVHK
uniref:Uncharacterized protein n=1 Tax=Lotharella globosa TaxID=91324 RepID=A0A6V3KNB4_9EUKA